MKLYAALGLALVTALVGLFFVRTQQARATAALDEARALVAKERELIGMEESTASHARRNTPGAVELALEDLRREIEYLRGAVEELHAGGLSRREPVDPAPRAGGEAGDSASLDLARLEASLRAEFASLRELIELGERHALVEAIRSDKRHVDWSAWEDVIAAWRRDPEEARKMVKLLTSDELIARFGPPNDVWANQLGLTWQYKRDHPLETDRTQEIILRLPDGYVAQLAVRELAREAQKESPH